MNVDSIRGFIRDRALRIADAVGPRGSELNDGKPIAVPLNYQRPPTLQEQIQRLIRTTLSDQAAADGYESFEEADDFDVGDDYDPSSPHEMVFDPLVSKEVPREIHSGLTAAQVKALDSNTEMEEEIPLKRFQKRLKRKSATTPAEHPHKGATTRPNRPETPSRLEGDSDMEPA